MPTLAGLFAGAVCVSGCAWILGGLEEGTERADATTPNMDASESGADAGAMCPGALPGFRYRRPIALDSSDASVNDFTLSVQLPTAELVAQGKVQPSGADYRFTDNDGRLLPFWLDDGADAGAGRALVRMSLRRGERAWLHYGNSSAASESRRMDAFVPGLVDDPTFARRDGWRVHFSADAADGEPAQWSTNYEDDGIRFKVSRGSGNNSTGSFACQTITFPAGSRYRVVFDVAFVREGNSTTSVIVSGLNRGSVWGHSIVEGRASLRARDEETVTFDPGTRVVCLNAGVATGGSVDAHFSRVRVRRVLATEPRAAVGAEERGCP